MLSRASTLEPAPVGVLDDDKTPDFNKELNIEEILAGTTGAAGTAADDVEATGWGSGTDAGTDSALTGGYAAGYDG